MPWDNEMQPEKSREEFVRLAQLQGSNISELCRRFNISRKTGYKWLKQTSYQKNPNFSNRSSRPKHIHTKVSKNVEDAVLSTRDLYPFWGASKLRAYMLRHEMDKKLKEKIPAASTINKILKRNGIISKYVSKQHQPFHRFERSQPNELWQMDFKGYFSIIEGDCHPLTILDDHSRFSICLQACRDETEQTVKPILTETFMKYGIPDAILMDNGACWRRNPRFRWSRIAIWLMRLGITVIHSSFHHPQTQGKDERFHKTLKTELLNDVSCSTFTECQCQFDHWRHTYNYERPHEALDMGLPASHYSISTRAFPKQLPPIRYFEGDIVRTLDENGSIYLNKRKIILGEALRGLQVAIRPSSNPGEINVFFCQQIIKKIEMSFETLRQGKNSVTNLCE